MSHYVITPSFFNIRFFIFTSNSVQCQDLEDRHIEIAGRSKFNELLNRDNSTQKIIGGLFASDLEAPYYVRLVSCEIDNPNHSSCQTCGGSWISDTDILSAGHCVSRDDKHVFYYLNPDDNSLVNEPSGKVSSWKHHECWDHRTTLVYADGYDIMILRVEGANFKDPVRLATSEEYQRLRFSNHPSDEYFVSYGFGNTGLSPFSTMPASLKKTFETQYFRCDLLNTFNNRPDIMCYETVNSHTIFTGDSGGPRVQNGIQYGIHSGFYWPNQLFAMQNSGSCITCGMNSVFTDDGNGGYSLAGGVSVDTAIGNYYTWIRGNSNYNPDGVFFGEEGIT